MGGAVNLEVPIIKVSIEGRVSERPRRMTLQGKWHERGEAVTMPGKAENEKGSVCGS
jgi:hypothetical protein